jgi:hypothetical protein
MNKHVVKYLAWFALISVGVTGCFTHELHERIKIDASYTEEVSYILISEDGKNLVFVGDDYHYVFDLPVEILRSLRSPFRKSLFAKFRKFRVDVNNKITGNIYISLDESASQSNKEEAIEFGYDKRSGSPVMEILLKGKRYKAEDLITDKTGYKLNYAYKVAVLEERTSVEKAALTATTPITVLADGVIAIVGVPLIILLQISPN